MGLQKDYYIEKFDITKTDCYWKIAVEHGLEGGKLLLICGMLCYTDKATADTNYGEHAGFNFEFVPDLESADNFFKQAYNHAKTLPEFSGAIDV